jgi:aldose sugar dehydrogenase
MKKRKFLFLSVVIALFLMACSPVVEDPKDDDPIDVENPIDKDPEIVFVDPVETNRPNTDFKPAFEGQTRISGIKTTTAYTTSVVTNKLSEPWGIDVLPNGDLVLPKNLVI